MNEHRQNCSVVILSRAEVQLLKRRNMCTLTNNVFQECDTMEPKYRNENVLDTLGFVPKPLL